MRDLKGAALVRGVHELIDRHRPIHVSLIGGEPLVRFRELEELLPQLAARGLHTQLVTSAVRPIPRSWARIPRLQIVVSIDGLAPEHDVRRAPATYERILKHIAGHRVTVHCTVTRQQAQRDGYLEESVASWSANPDTRQIWMSLYTPQVGEYSDECLTADDRQRVIGELMRLRTKYPALKMAKGLIEAYAAFFPFRAIVPVSALKGEACQDLINEVLKLLPVGQRYYPEEQVTEHSPVDFRRPDTNAEA